MSATPGSRLKVLPAGLHQLDVKCQTLAGELAAMASPVAVAASAWQSNANVVSTAGLATGKDLAALSGRVRARGNAYSTAGSGYSADEQDAKEKFVQVRMI